MPTRLVLPMMRGWRLAAILVVLAAVVGGAIAGANRVEAHAFLDRSDPPANAVLPEQPAEMRLWFTEPLEPGFSSAQLYDADGKLVETEQSRIGDANQMILPLPAGLPNGTYTVQWRNISTADGHPQQGYVPFTIGSQADVVVPVTPEASNFDAPPIWVDAIGRWLSLLGVVGAAGALITWLLVLRPAQEPFAPAVALQMRQRVTLFIYALVGIGVLGNLIALGVQIATTGEGFSPSVASDILTDTRFGQLWIARVVLLLGLAAAVASNALWQEPPSRLFVGLALALGAGAMLPFSLNSHSSGLEAGRTAAIASDWIHIMATTVWVGGLLTTLVALIYGTRGAERADRRASYAIAISRFTTLAAGSVVILILTGFYSAWLHVGNLIGLFETDYGRALVVKLALIVPLLALGAVNMVWLGPRMKAAARSGVHFGRTVAGEAMLGVGVLFAVGLLTTMPTARETLVSEAESTTFHFFENDAHIVLIVSPGAVGQNLYTVDVDLNDQAIPDGSQVLLRMENQGELEGIREVELAPAGEERFEAGGSELSVVGDWELELIFRRPAETDMRFTQEINVPRTPPAERVPGPAPVFTGESAAFAMLFIAVAVFAIIASLRMPGVWQDRVIGTGIGGALLIAGAAILLIAREPTTPTAQAANPVPLTQESVAQGRQLFLENCAICHGENAEGDGPAASSLSRQPANFYDSHVGFHPDGDLFWWIQNGIQPSMPGFGDELSDQEIWHLVNYVRSLQTTGERTE